MLPLIDSQGGPARTTGPLAFARFALAFGLSLLAVILLAGPAVAAVDTDGDGFSDEAEIFMGTDPTRACGETAVSNDEQTDAWPPDLDDDAQVGIFDVTVMREAYGSTSGDANYSSRLDLTVDGRIDLDDMLVLRAFYGETCTPSEPPAAETFLETFDGDPAAPKSFYDASPNWDVSIQSRFDKDVVMDMPYAQHGSNCGGPPATHFNNDYTGVVYECRNHVMTSVRTGGYAAVYLMPNYMVDFSQGEAVIRIDRSTLSTSTRDWTDFWITPFEDNVQFPLDDFQAFLAGNPRNSVHIDGGTIEIIREFDDNELSTTWWKGIEEILARKGLEPSPTRRDTVEIRISRDHLSYCMPDFDFCWYDGVIDPPLTWTRGVFQFGHHSYNPTKGAVPPGHDCALVGMEGVCPEANTWHWDNVEIAPAVPFTIVHSDRRFVEYGDPNPTVTFDEPAPAGSFLRFMTMRDEVATEISLDSGQTWVTAEKQLASKEGGTPANVWHPVPEGTTSVQVRAAPGSRSDWFAFDFRLFSEEPPPSDAASVLSSAQLEERLVTAQEDIFGCSIEETPGALLKAPAESALLPARRSADLI